MPHTKFDRSFSRNSAYIGRASLVGREDFEKIMRLPKERLAEIAVRFGCRLGHLLIEYAPAHGHKAVHEEADKIKTENDEAIRRERAQYQSMFQ